MCVSDTSGRSHQGVLQDSDRQAAAGGEVTATRKSIGVRLLSGLVQLYRLILSPWLGPRCRFLPTCSEYALDALARHGAIRGCWLTASRLTRCHPFGGSGFDPVPETFSTADMFKSSKYMHKAGPRASEADQTIGQRRPEPTV